MTMLKLFCKKEMFFLLFLSVLFAATSSAQTPTKVYLNVGSSFAADPVGLREQHNPGINLGVGIGLPLNQRLELVLAAHYNQFRQRDIGITEFSRIESGNDHISSATAGFKYNITAQKLITPYLLVNGGVYHWVSERLTYARPGRSFSYEGLNRTALGFDIGAGISFQLSSVLRVNLEPRYTWAFFSGLDDDRLVQYAPVRLGIEWLR